MLFIVMLFLTGCSNTMVFKQGDNTSRIQLLKQLQCGKQTSLEGDKLQPPALYQQMNECVEKSNYQAATLLFALAGSYTWYDAIYTDTSLAKKKHSELLADALSELRPESRDILWSNIQTNLGNKQQLAGVCQKIRLIGRPKYLATYIQQQKSGEDDHARKRWNTALVSYLHCDSE